VNPTGIRRDGKEKAKMDDVNDVKGSTIAMMMIPYHPTMMNQMIILHPIIKKGKNLKRKRSPKRGRRRRRVRKERKAPISQKNVEVLLVGKKLNYISIKQKKILHRMRLEKISWNL